MAKRPQRRRTSDSAITANSHVMLSMQQLLVSIGAVLMVGSAYAYLVWNQAAATKDISDIKNSVAAVSASTANVTKEQDTKREQLGKDFLASNEKIASKVSDLNSALLVQQEQTKEMTNTLTTISNQLGEVLLHPPASMRSPTK